MHANVMSSRDTPSALFQLLAAARTMPPGINASRTVLLTASTPDLRAGKTDCMSGHSAHLAPGSNVALPAAACRLHS